MAVKVNVEALDLISQLGQEMVVAYEAEDKTVATIVSDLLAFQLRTPAITVGTISGSYSALTRSIKVDGDTILRALYKLHSTVGGYIHVDNDRELQWADSIGEDKGQQLRYNKNLKGIERDINYRGLVNRLYAYGAGEGTARIKLSDAEGQDQDYVQNQASHDAWGGWYPGSLVDISITHPDTLLAWANLRLAEIKDPIISYSVNVVDLSESDVAEFSFDALQLGSIVKVIDEDLGIDVSVSVVKITHNDLANPQNMTVELSSRVKDITDTLMEVYGIQQFQQHIATVIGAGQVIVKGTFTVLDWATGGETTIDGSNIETGTVTLGMLNFIPLTSEGETGEIIATINATIEGGLRISADKISLAAGRSIFKQDGIPTSLSVGDLWFDTDDDNKLYRADSIGADAITPGEWELVRDDQISTNAASITVNENQISLNVTDISNLEGDMVTAEAAIVVNANAISLEVTNRTNADTTLQGNITVNANAISLEVTNRTNADSTLQGQITVNAGNILLKVSKNDVINQINISTEGIKIDADNITLDGVVAVTDDIKSSNYSVGVAGWIIEGDGSCEFNEMTIRGTVSAGQDIRSSNYAAGSAGWIIEGSGDAEFNEVTVRGAVYATSGEFTGTLKASNIEAGKTLTVNGSISAADGRMLIHSGGITLNTTTGEPSALLRLSRNGTVYGFLLTTGTAAEFRGEPGYVVSLGSIQADVHIGASISGVVRVYSTLEPYDNNSEFLGVSAKRWKGGYFVSLNVSGTATIGTLSITTIGATTGNITTVNATTVNAANVIASTVVRPDSNLGANLGDSSYRWAAAYFQAVNMGVYGVISGPSGIGSRMGTATYYPEQTHSDEWVLHCSIPSFSQLDNLALLRSIQEKDGKLDIETFPDMICVAPDMAVENAVIDAECRGKSKSEQKTIRQEANEKLARKAISMGNWQSLNMGAILQLADRYDELEARVAALN